MPRRAVLEGFAYTLTTVCCAFVSDVTSIITQCHNHTNMCQRVLNVCALFGVLLLLNVVVTVIFNYFNIFMIYCKVSIFAGIVYRIEIMIQI